MPRRRREDLVERLDLDFCARDVAAGVVAADVSVLSTGGRAGSVKKESETSLACSLTFLFCAHLQVSVEVSVRVTFTRNN